MRKLRLLIYLVVISFLSLFITELIRAQDCSIFLDSRCSNNGQNLDANQLEVEVTENNGTVSFVFKNNGNVASSITQIYIDDEASGLLSGIDSIINGMGVDFSQGASPPSLPSEGSCVPPFDTTNPPPELRASSDPPTQQNGINPNEMLTIVYDRSGAEDICDALASCELRVGVHVQAIGTGGQSDAYTHPCVTPTPTPTPTGPTPTPTPTPTGPTPTPTVTPTPTLPFCEIPTCEIFAVFSDSAQVNVQSLIGINPELGPGGLDIFGNNLDLPCDIDPQFPCASPPCTESFIITCDKDDTNQRSSLGVEVCVDPDLIQGEDRFDCCNFCDPAIGGDSGFEPSGGCSIAAIGSEKIGLAVAISGPFLILVLPIIVVVLRRRFFGK